MLHNGEIEGARLSNERLDPARSKTAEESTLPLFSWRLGRVVAVDAVLTTVHVLVTAPFLSWIHDAKIGRHHMDTLQDVLLRPPAEIMAWLDSVRRGEISVSPGFNWLGLAEAAGADAIRSGDENESLTWGEVAIGVYDTLRRQAESESAARSLLLSTMNLRAHLIMRFGSGPAGSVRDPDLVLALFRLNTPIESHSTAARLVQQTPLSMEEMRSLRFLKNLLGPLRLLAQHGYIDHASDMDAWLGLKNRLP